MSAATDPAMRTLVSPQGAPFLDVPGFARPVLFPDAPAAPRRVLHVGAYPMAARALAAAYPEAEVATTAALGATEDGPPEERLTHVALEGESLGGADGFDLVTYDDRALATRPARDAALARLVAALAPGGALVASFPSRLARTGLLAASELLRRYAAHAGEMDGVSLAKHVLGSIPRGHHFRLRAEFAAEIAYAGADALTGLYHLVEDDLCSVPEVLARIETAGGHFAGWLFPAAYDPTQFVRDPVAAAELAALPEPRRSAVCELCTAHPTVHHAIVRKAPSGAEAAGSDPLACRPVRLPTYAWSEAKPDRDGRALLEPTPRTEFTGRIPLSAWHVRVALAADGALSGRRILEQAEVRRAFDLPPDRWPEALAAFLVQSHAFRTLALLPPA